MEWHPQSPRKKKRRTIPSAGKVMLAVFWDIDGVILVEVMATGLSAAKLLNGHEVEVVVLDASDRVGGRTLTLTPSAEAGDPQYGWVDLGGTYVGPTQNHILRMCKELGCETYKCRDNYNSIYFTKGRRCCYLGTWPGFWWSNPFAALDLRVAIRTLDDMARQVPTDRPWQTSRAIEWDSMTVKDFLSKLCWTKDAREFLESVSICNNTAGEHEMSLLFFLWYIRQAQGMHRIWNVMDGAQEQKIVGGSQQISIKIAEKLGARIHLNKAVVQIRYTEDGVMVKTLDGTVFNGSHVILAIPPPLHLKIHFDPPLPSLRHGLIQRFPMGLVIKCIPFYKREFWAEKGYNGLVTCKDGIEVVGSVDEDHKPGVSLYGLICFVYGQHALSLKDMKQSDRRDAVCHSLAKFYDSKEALEPVHYADKLWLEEPYIGGCYTAYLPPGVLSQYGPAIREPIGNRIYIAGTESAVQWTGYMNGAIEAGERAAREVLHAKGKISHSDVWVTEPDFVEVPLLPVQLSSLDKNKLILKIFASFGALTIGLLVSFLW